MNPRESSRPADHASRRLDAKPATVERAAPWSGPEARRLYEVSRECYAPALAAFATRWLEELARQPCGVALCLGRDGLAAFLAARTLLRMHPRRFRRVPPSSVRLAYLSRPLVRDAACDPAQRGLLDRYLRARGVHEGRPLMLVDVGIHGSIQDCIQKIYRERAITGQYLVLRRRSDDANGATKHGFLVELDVAPQCALEIGQSLPALPSWDLGGIVRRGDPVFLRPQSVRVLEDLWNGVGDSAERFDVSAKGQSVTVVRSRLDQVIELPLQARITARQRIEYKCAALRGVVDGVARDWPGGGRNERDATDGLAGWLGSLDDPSPIDARILGALVREGGLDGAAGGGIDGGDDLDKQ